MKKRRGMVASYEPEKSVNSVFKGRNEIMRSIVKRIDSRLEAI